MASGRTRLVYSLCFLLIALSLAVIAWKVPRLFNRGKPDRQPLTSEAVGALLDRELPVDEGRSLRLADSKADYLVLFFFTPGDCAACLPEIRDLNRLASERSDLTVAAVMSYSNFDEARQTHENFSVDIPIVQDPEGELLHAIDPPHTPWKLVIHRKGRRLLFEEGRTITPEERAAFLTRVREYLSEGSRRDDTAGG